MELWSDPDGSSQEPVPDEIPRAGAGLDALLQDVLVDLDFGGADAAEPVEAPNAEKDMLRRAGDVLMSGRLASFENMAVQLGCARSWVPVL